MYGVFEHYEVKLTGIRAGFEDHVVINNIEDVEYQIDTLRPEYNYTVEITVITQNFVSSTVSESFQTPAGGK